MVQEKHIIYTAKKEGNKQMKTGFPPALTQLSEEEQLLQSTVRDFALDRIAPLVAKMDEA